VFATAGTGLFEDRTGHPRFNEARANGVDAHSGAGQLIGCRLHQTDDAGLAGAVGHAPGAGAQARDRRRADDGAAPARRHRESCVLGREEGADQVDVEHLRPALDGFLEEGNQTAADSGVGVAHIESAVFPQSEGDGAGDIELRRGVLDQRGGAPAGRSDRIGRCCDFRRAIERDHRGALGREQ
jgi:hypothetical protein